MATVVIKSGPLFDGRADKAATEYCDELAHKVADLGKVLVRANLNEKLKHQTPYYRTQIEATTFYPGTWKVTDQGVIYGPWLEGEGSRNRTTRFKGYHVFRRTTQELRGRVRSEARILLQKYLPRMN